MREKLENIQVGRIALIKYKYGRITKVIFRKRKPGRILTWDHYEANI